ncbi:hypothetical protein NDA01_20880 [Trichocoleus desertorum AS-A10]|uniref:hypothetical protein n=1 Tax=Trichocoleus desertorum TaxID=1481672 RepID=UPI0032996B9D
MGFLKGLGQIAGKVVGGAVGGALEIAGEVADSETLKKAGKGVYNVTAASGEILGSLADGAVTTVHGVVTKDGEKVKEGLGDAGHAAMLTAEGLGHTVKHTAIGTAHLVKEIINQKESSSINTKIEEQNLPSTTSVVDNINSSADENI